MPAPYTGAEYRGSVNAAIPISDIARREKLTDDRIAVEVDERLRVASNEQYLDRSKVWVRNLLMVYGEQWIRYNEFARRWLRKPVGRERRFTTNLLIGRLNFMAAKLTQGRPSFTAMPLSPDLQERRAAKLAERLLLDDWRTLNLGLVRHEAILDALMFGMGIIEVGWDQRAGPLTRRYEVLTNELGREVLDELGNPVFRLNQQTGEPILKDVWFEGAVYARCVSPFAFFVPPHLESSRLKDSPWCIRTVWMSEEQIRAAFDLPPSFELGPLNSEFEHVEPLASYVQRFASNQGMQPNLHEGQMLVISYYEQATDVKGFEHGKVYHVVNGKLVHEDRSQFDDGRYPFFTFQWTPRRGQFWPQAWISDQTEPQARYNQTVSHILTHLSMFANPNILNPKGSGVPTHIAFNFRMYHYNPAAGAPQFWVPPPPSNAIFQMLDRAKNDLDAVGSTYGTSRGEHQQGMPSALYAQILEQADATEMGPFLRQHSESWERLGEALVDLHRLYDRPERILAIVGKSNRPEMVGFQQDQLPSRFRFVVAETSMQAVSPAARIEQAKVLAKEGFFGAFADQPQVRKALLEFVRMPELLDVETGESLLLRAIEELHVRLIEEGMPMKPPGWAIGEEQILLALRAAMTERLMREDVWDWDDDTHQRVLNYKTELEKALAELERQRVEAQKQMQVDQLNLQTEAERRKSAMRKDEKVSAVTAKAGAELLGMHAQAQPPVPGVQ